MNDAEAQFCRDNYGKLSRRELVEAVNSQFNKCLTLKQITSWVKNRKINSGRTGRFQKGNVPTYIPPKGTRNAGSFKKGSSPHNARVVGYEMIDRDGYVQICVAEHNPHNGAPTRMRHKHRWIWEQVHGEIPVGMRIKFLDGDRTNCSIDNLAIIEDSAAPKVKKVHELPKELRVPFLLTARIETAIKRRNA